jgi:uncharacterized protein
VTAARNPDLAAAIAQAPNADGPVAGRHARRHTTTRAFLRLLGRAALDAIAGRLGRPPRLVPLAGEPGTVALLSTPDGVLGDTALNPGGRYPDWRQEVAARSVLGVALYRPIRRARDVQVPLLVVAYDDDRSALAGPAIRAGERAPQGEVVRLPGGHYAAFLDEHEATVDAELEFLTRTVVVR